MNYGMISQLLPMLMGGVAGKPAQPQAGQPNMGALAQMLMARQGQNPQMPPMRPQMPSSPVPSPMGVKTPTPGFNPAEPTPYQPIPPMPSMQGTPMPQGMTPQDMQQIWLQLHSGKRMF